MKTTLSKDSIHSSWAWMSFLAPLAPFLIETTGHLLSCTSDIERASTSPSVMTRWRPPPFDHLRWPKRVAALASPKNLKSLLGRRTFWAQSWP